MKQKIVLKDSFQKRIILKNESRIKPMIYLIF